MEATKTYSFLQFSRRLWLLICLLVLTCSSISASNGKGRVIKAKKQQSPSEALQVDETNQDGNFLKFCYRVGRWLDNYSLKGLDTSYITLPEYPWRIALTNSEVGIHSTFLVDNKSEFVDTRIVLNSQTTPSIDLGFHVGVRTLGFGYSWDALHAYARKLNFSMGGKAWGVELLRQTSTNIHSTITFPKLEKPDSAPQVLENIDIWMTNTNLTAWLALNSAHYSHNAAIKQAYIQQRTAGSLLLNLSYLNTDISFNPDSTGVGTIVLYFLDNVRHVVTHQVAVGLGYGINYTPNKGKVLIHASAAAQAVFHSINYISYDAPDTLRGFAYPSYAIKPTSPVHFTGTMRAAVSWEINKWVHMHVRAQVDNIRFRARTDNGVADLANWNWQASLAFAVRLGVGTERKNRALGIVEPPRHVAEIQPAEPLVEGTEPSVKSFSLPTWITDYFFSPMR